MSKKLIKIINRRAFFSAATVCLMFGVWTANAAPQTPAQKPVSQGSNIGEIRIDNYRSMDYEPSQKPGVIEVAMTGPSLVITSPRYRMAAPRIELTFKNGRVLTGSATGGVQVTVKDTAANQTTQVTCGNATYTSGTAVNRGRIDLKGTVRSKTYSPGFSEPLVSESESGVIEFSGNGSPRVRLTNGSASVTLTEPTPTPAPAKK
jgi:hypothetical protein